MSNEDNKNPQTSTKIKMMANPHQVEEIYVDGISGVFGRGGVMKLDCYRVVGIDKEDNAEVRQITHRLVIPNSAVPELMKAMQGVADTVKAARDKHAHQTTSETVQ
jgi:hypothetical protein